MAVSRPAAGQSDALTVSCTGLAGWAGKEAADYSGWRAQDKLRARRSGDGWTGAPPNVIAASAGRGARDGTVALSFCIAWSFIRLRADRHRSGARPVRRLDGTARGGSGGAGRATSRRARPQGPCDLHHGHAARSADRAAGTV